MRRISISEIDELERMAKAPKTEQEAIDAIVASQTANKEPIDPAGAKRFVRTLIAVGLFKADDKV